MMISPYTFIEEYKDYSYEQLVAVRNDLLKEILDHENYVRSGEYDLSIMGMCPSPDVVYQCNMEYLLELITLMNKKQKGNELFVDYASEEEQMRFIYNVLIRKQEFVPDSYIKKAKSLLTKLVKRGNADALNLKGAMYYEGNGVKQNQKKAVELYIKAAEAGSSLAMSNLGYAYFYGNGTDIDYALAYKYFTMAEQRGEWEAFNKLGDMYMNGLYVPKNEAMAFSLYDHCYKQVPHDATNDAYPACITRIAECLIRGTGVAVNHIVARQLLEEAISIYELQIADGNYYAPLCIERTRNAMEELVQLEQELEREMLVFGANED